MSFKKSLTAVVLAATLSLSGCGANNAEQPRQPKQPEYVEATVLDELSSPSNVGENYAIKFKIGETIYSASLLRSSASYRYIEALDVAIDKGTKVLIKKDSLGRFSKDRIGHLYTDEIFLEN